MIDQLKKILEKVLRETTSLVETAATHESAFLNVLLGIYRVSFTTLRDIYYLSNNEDSGASALDLSRKVAEHAISVEYMVLKDKEKMATEFQDYLWVQVKQEVEFLKSIGQNPAGTNEEFKLGTEDAESKYNSLSNELKNRKTWAGRPVDGMLEDLYKNKALLDFDYSRISQAYVWGSRLNHPNPLVVSNYLNSEDSKVADEYYLRQALFMAITFHLRLTTRYIDELRTLNKSNLYPELAKTVTDIYKELDELGKP